MFPSRVHARSVHAERIPDLLHAPARPDLTVIIYIVKVRCARAVVVTSRARGDDAMTPLCSRRAHEVPRTPMSDLPPPPPAHAKRPRAAEMHGTADGGWDGDDGSVMSTRLWVGGAAGQTQR